MSNPYEDEGVHVGHATVQQFTEKALLVELDDGGEYWLMKSQLHPDSEIGEDADIDDEGELVVTEFQKEKLEENGYKGFSS